MIVDSKNIPQFIDELNIEVDQIKKELQQTVRNVEYASEYSEGVKLGDLLVGSQSTRVITPQIALTPGPESGQFYLELPVGTESGQIIRPGVQNDANAESLEPEALLTGQTVESYLNSNFVKINKRVVNNSSTGIVILDNMDYTKVLCAVSRNWGGLFPFVTKASSGNGPVLYFYMVNNSGQLTLLTNTSAEAYLYYIDN